MARTLDASQTRYQHADLFAVNLVKLTTYTDRAAKTGAFSFYFSDQAVVYDYGNTGTDQTFLPLLNGTSDLFSSINHVPGPDDGGLLRRSVSIFIDNAIWSGERMIARLRQYNLVNAEIEFAQLLLDTEPAVPIDLSAMTGDEHTVFFRGRVRRPGPVSNDLIELQCETGLPSMAGVWIYAQGETVERKDVGLRYPYIYGAKKRVPVIGSDVGWVTTLSEPIDEDFTGIAVVADASGFPSGHFRLRIGNEEMTGIGYSNASQYLTRDVVDTRLGITGSGSPKRRGPNPVQHSAGEVCVEIQASTVYSVSGSAISAVRDVYVENPVVSEDVVLIDPGLYTVDTSTPANISIEQNGMSTLLARLFADVEFTPGSAEDPEIGVDIRSPSSRTSSATSYRQYAKFTDGSILTWRGASFSGTLTQTAAQLWFTNIVGTVPIERYRIFGRMILSYTDQNGAGYGAGLQISSNNMPGSDNAFASSHLYTSFGTRDITKYSNWVDVSGQDVIPEDFNGPEEPTSENSVSEPHILVKNGVPFASDTSFLPGFNEASLDVSETGIEFETLSTPGAPTGSTQFFGATLGFGLNVYADVDGITAPDGTYDAQEGSLLTHPADILKHWIEVVGGETIDSTSYAALITNLGMNKLALDARAFGLTWEQVLGRIAYESRVNIVPEETSSGRVWKVLSAGSDYKWPDPTESITVHGDGFIDNGRDLEQMSAYHTFRYGLDSSLGTGEEAFRGIAVANPTTSDVSVTAAQLTSAEERFGDVDSQPVFFLGIRDKFTAEEVAGYIVHESIAEDRRVFSIDEIPWYEGYTLEVGDMRWIVPPWNRLLQSDDRVFSHDALGDWVANGATPSLETAETYVYEGSGSIKATSISSTYCGVKINDYSASSGGSLRDCRNLALSIRCYVPTATYDLLESTGAALEFRVGSSSSFGSDWVAFGVSRSRIVADTWQRWIVPLSSTPTSSAGTVDLSGIKAWGWAFILENAPLSSLVAYWDDARLVNDPVSVRVIEVVKNTETEHVSIQCVEVPPTPTAVAATPPSDPTSIYYVQQARQIYTDLGSEQESRRVFARDGNRTESLNHFVSLLPREVTSAASAPHMLISFDSPTETILTQTIRVWITQGTVAGSDVELRDLSSIDPEGQYATIGSISSVEMPTAGDIPLLFEFGPLTTSTNWLMLQLVTDADGMQEGGGTGARIFQVERELFDTLTPADSIVAANSPAAGGTGADLDNAVDGDEDTYAELDDGEYIHVDWAAPAAYDAQLVRFLIDSNDPSNYPEAFSAYLGDQRGGSPTAVLTIDTAPSVTDYIVSSQDQDAEKVWVQLYTTTADDDLYLYSETGLGKLRVYAIERNAVRIPDRIYSQLAERREPNTNEHSNGRGGVLTPTAPSGNIAGRFRQIEVLDEHIHWFPSKTIDINHWQAFQFPSPPTAISTTQTIRFRAKASDVSTSDQLVVGTGTSKTSQTTIDTLTIGTTGYEEYSITTALTGDWFTFKPEAGGRSFRIMEVRRELPDTTYPTVEVQSGASTAGTGADLANAIDGDSDTYATLTPNDHIQVTFAAPSGSPTVQLITIRLKNAGQFATSGFSCWLGGLRDVGTPAFDDDYWNMFHVGNFSAPFEIQFYVSSLSNDFYLYNESGGEIYHQNLHNYHIHSITREMLEF